MQTKYIYCKAYCAVITQCVSYWVHYFTGWKFTDRNGYYDLIMLKWTDKLADVLTYIINVTFISYIHKY